MLGLCLGLTAKIYGLGLESQGLGLSTQGFGLAVSSFGLVPWGLLTSHLLIISSEVNNYKIKFGKQAY